MYRFFKQQKGMVSPKLLLILAVVGLVIYLAVATNAPFTDLVFDALYPKPASFAATALPNCWPTSGPGLAGTIAGQPNAIWCYTDYSDGPSTAVKGTNTWVDDFNHNLAFGKWDTTNYSDFPITGSLYKSQLFRHANHWMRDIAGSDQGGEGSGGWNFGAAAMRPNATFKAEGTGDNRILVIEADVATRVAAYGGNLFWPEIVVTTADHPTQIRSNGTYVYEAFPGAWTLGCRLQNDGGFTCALLDNSNNGDSTARVWELSHFQCSNTPGGPGYNGGCHSIYGGIPSNLPAQDAAYSRDCVALDPDTNCRDRWRWEITPNRLTWYVNGVKYMEHKDFDANRRVPDVLLNGPVYVYFGEFLYKLDTPARMHWDRIAINPKDANGNLLPASKAETFCLGMPLNTCGVGTPAPTTPTPRPTTTAVPTPTPTPAPVVTPPPGSVTVTFDDRAGQNQALTGQYPSGILDWGTGSTWFHSSPFESFTTKSVTFNGANITSASVAVVVGGTKLSTLDAYNGGTVASTVTLSCGGQTTRTFTLASKQLQNLQTNWTGICSPITLSSTNGWNTNFDNLVFTPTSTGVPTAVPTSSTPPIADIFFGGKVYIDSNNNGQFNTGEAGVSNRPILVNGNTFCTTDTSGECSRFGAVSVGQSYTVSHILPPNFSNTSPNSVQVTAMGGPDGKQLVAFGIRSTFPESPAPTPTLRPSPTPIRQGDCDKDGDVDIFDYNAVLRDYGKTGSGLQCDLDINGKVDIFDYNILIRDYGH